VHLLLQDLGDAAEIEGIEHVGEVCLGDDPGQPARGIGHHHMPHPPAIHQILHGAQFVLGRHADRRSAHHLLHLQAAEVVPQGPQLEHVVLGEDSHRPHRFDLLSASPVLRGSAASAPFHHHQAADRMGAHGLHRLLQGLVGFHRDDPGGHHLRHPAKAQEEGLPEQAPQAGDGHQSHGLFRVVHYGEMADAVPPQQMDGGKDVGELLLAQAQHRGGHHRGQRGAAQIELPGCQPNQIAGGDDAPKSSVLHHEHAAGVLRHHRRG
jgi:hypothetical protein